MSPNLPPDSSGTRLKAGDQTWAQQVIHGDYHPYIDGLRSLAVLPVVFYHLFMPICPAGFMGVDVFFVISGHLICGGIMRDLKKGTFTMTSFYYRRIRRIFPAYLALCVAVLAAGVALYHWARIVPLAQTALFSTFFSTNLYFWLDMGYFQPNAHANPLLNLWSLGVEEQFYISIPLALWLVWRIRPRWLVPAMVLCAAASLALCLGLGEKGQSTTAFYILPTRGWELLAGAILAALPKAANTTAARRLSLFGMGLLAFSFWCFSTEKTFNQGGTSVEWLLPFVGSLGFHPFPGWVTLPVIAGSLLLLRYGNFGIAGKVLRWRPLVGIGKISYSLYLWHWPLIVFMRYVTYERPQPLWMLACVLAASLLAAYASWRWVEMPFRVRRSFAPRHAFLLLGIGCAGLLAVNAWLISTEGLRHVLHHSANVHAASPRPFLKNFDKFRPLPAFQPPAYPALAPAFMRPLGCPDQRHTFCLLGDSHAAALAPGLDAVAKAHRVSGVHLLKEIPPLIQAGDLATDQALREWIAGHPDLRDVYLVGRWMHFHRLADGLPNLGEKGRVPPVRVDDPTAREIETNFRRTAEWFARHGKRVFVFTCVPEYAYHIADVTARRQMIPLRFSVGITRQDYLNRQLPVSQVLEPLQAEGLITLVPVHEAFFSGNESVFMDAAGRPYYSDGDHLTPEGARHAVESVAALLWGSPALISLLDR